MRLVLVALVLLAVGCARNGSAEPRKPRPYRASSDARELSQVIPRPGGEFDVLSHWSNQEQAMAWALEMAKQTCSERGQQFVVVEQQIAYKGNVPEDVHKKSDMVRQGLPVPVVRNIFIPNLRTKKDYEVGLRCKCEPLP